tara:strand:- start:1434 stop:1712 length:279 start_codon:yes stop_codon:yes gene_type:complete
MTPEIQKMTTIEKIDLICQKIESGYQPTGDDLEINDADFDFDIDDNDFDIDDNDFDIDSVIDDAMINITFKPAQLPPRPAQLYSVDHLFRFY